MNMKNMRVKARWMGFALIVLCGTTAGCARVAPFQRGRLAHPTMLLGDLAGPAENHIYAIQEGAVGGASAVEGGCGCN